MKALILKPYFTDLEKIAVYTSRNPDPNDIEGFVRVNSEVDVLETDSVTGFSLIRYWDADEDLYKEGWVDVSRIIPDPRYVRKTCSGCGWYDFSEGICKFNLTNVPYPDSPTDCVYFKHLMEEIKYESNM